MSDAPTFEQLGLAPALAARVAAHGWSAPLPIQREALPPALAGADVLGRSQTGTGKTAAFALPIAQRLGERSAHRTRALVIVPTRELATQVEAELRWITAGTTLRGALVVGGLSIDGQRAALAEGVDWIVATPGRLVDLLHRGWASLNAVEVLVLDEADQLMALGFLDDIKAIAEVLPPKRQTMLFSATLPREIAQLARTLLTRPVRIEVGDATSADAIVEQLWPVAAPQKLAFLEEWLARQAPANALVFTRTRERASRLGEQLAARGWSVEVLHAERPMGERRAALEAFRSGRVRLLVATDVAARGLDIVGVAAVVNYDVPVAPEDYIHRVGRTARAGRTGVAATLMSAREAALMARVEHLTRKPLKPQHLEDFEYLPEAENDGRAPQARDRDVGSMATRKPSAERKESPFTKSGQARHGFAIPDDPTPRDEAKRRRKSTRKRLPHQR